MKGCTRAFPSWLGSVQMCSAECDHMYCLVISKRQSGIKSAFSKKWKIAVLLSEKSLDKPFYLKAGNRSN